MKKGKLVLIRHGESMGQNWSGHYRDDSTNFLSPTGLDQALQCGSMLNALDIEFSHVFCSTMTRARHTCMMVLHGMGETDRSPDIISELISEQDMRAVKQKLEHDVEVASRMLEFYHNHVHEALYEGNVMLVSHYHALQIFITSFLANEGYITVREIHPKNATPIILDFENDIGLNIMDTPWEGK